ncbi:MAG: PilN domain-containing protein [Rhodocyclales bacterium]|nr:PilN domain-containing protein [Rhodocyclales bacterium]
MSAQINLYHPRFLRQRDLLSLGNVVIAVVTLYTLLAAAGGWAWQNATMHREAAAAVEAQLASAREQVEVATQAAAIRKPSTQLIAELENAEGLLRRRGEIARLLESGAVGSTGGFADYLRGFARQAPEGLWLTGFTIGSGGNDMEIRGSMLNPAALPDYIRRLGTEKAFQGRNFAALTMNRVDTPATVRAVGQGAAVPAAATSIGVPPAPSQGVALRTTPAPSPIDFVLLPRLVEAREAGK